ncbi:MAG: hypothetical protein ACYDFU_06695 [Nitrospirota bacterium]
MDAIKEIRRAFHDYMDGRITKAELEERLREIREQQSKLPLKEKEAA